MTSHFDPEHYPYASQLVDSPDPSDGDGQDSDRPLTSNRFRPSLALCIGLANNGVSHEQTSIFGQRDDFLAET